jgi:hypothetical protein
MAQTPLQHKQFRAMTKPVLRRQKKISASLVTTAAKVETISDFINEIRKFAQSETKFKCYRGQRNAAWENIPGLLRPDLRLIEENEKRATRDLISVHPNEFSSDQTMFDKLVRMQHFDLPTRLMDVSKNPLVALYFATEVDKKGEEADGQVTAFSIPEEREKYYDSDTVSCLANLANLTKSEKNQIIHLRKIRPKGTRITDDTDTSNITEIYKRLHQFIRTEKPYFLPIIKPIDLFKPYYVHPKMNNRRIIAQAGGFIIYGLQPPKSINFAHIIEETRFIIPEEKKSSLRSDLDLLGINESTLFPELDKAAKRIKLSYAGG